MVTLLLIVVAVVMVAVMVFGAVNLLTTKSLFDTVMAYNMLTGVCDVLVAIVPAIIAGLTGNES